MATVSPQRGLRRHQARQALSLVTQARSGGSHGYDAGKASRLRDGWNTGSNSAFQISQNVRSLRNAARDLCRNNDYAAKFRRSWAANTVGEGINLSFQMRDAPNLSKDLDNRWWDWMQGADVEGNLAFYGIQNLVAKTVVESGECLIVRQNPPRSRGSSTRMKLRVMEPEFIDETRIQYPGNDENQTIRGIEYDRWGRKVAYWLYPEHPQDFDRSYYRNRESIRVPAEQVCHVFEIDRPGQQRGITRFAPVILRLHDIKDYDLAETTRKRVEACLTAWVHGDVDYSIGAEVQGVDIAGLARREAGFEPGMVNYMPTGSDVTMSEPKASGDYMNFMAAQLHAVAAGLGISYEAMSGDLSRVNYSSLRYGNNEFRRYIREFRENHLIPQLCERVRGWFIEDLIDSNTIREGIYPAEWRAPRLESIDPLKDVMAELMEVRMGKKSMQRVIGEDGYSFRDVLQECKEYADLADKLELVFDSDPRKVAKSGAIQPTEVGNDNED